VTHSQAVKIALEAMRKEIKQYAFDANLYERFGERNPTAENAFKKRTELLQAVKVLKGQGKMI
jgi:hypothetical protein